MSIYQSKIKKPKKPKKSLKNPKMQKKKKINKTHLGWVLKKNFGFFSSPVVIYGF